jgi:hypothetical protein
MTFSLSAYTLTWDIFVGSGPDTTSFRDRRNRQLSLPRQLFLKSRDTGLKILLAEKTGNSGAAGKRCLKLQCHEIFYFGYFCIFF